MIGRRAFGTGAAAAALTFSRSRLAPGQVSSKVLRVVPQAEPQSFDPVFTQVNNVSMHGAMIYDQLFGWDDKMNVQPQMVDDWKTTDDRLLYTFTLRRGLKFHDGGDVTTRDVTDPFTPVKERIGSGPFRFIDAEYRPGAKLVYEKFDGYVPRSEPASGFAGGKVAKIDRVEWVIIPDTSVAFNALRSGEVDMLDAPPLDLLPTVANDRNIVIGEVWPLESYAVLRFNSIHPPFNDVKARQAVAHAFSQIDYMSAAYGDPKLWHECYAYWVCGSPNGTEIGSEPYRKPDLDRARQLVRESGYDGTPVVVIGGSDIPAYQRLSLVTVDLLQKIGFKVDLQLSDWGSVATRRQKKDPPAQGGWNLFHTSVNGAQLSSPLTSPSTITTCDGKNFPGWPCDQVEEDMRLRYIREPDAAKRMALLQDMHRRLWEVVPYLPLGQFVQPFLWRSNISGVLRSNVLAFWNISKA
jgi:peptide/nickel transport system substrate-binding protein